MKPKKIVPKDSPVLRLMQNSEEVTKFMITDYKPAYRVVDRLRFSEICQLSLDGDPRFPTIESVQDEALRLGFLEQV